MDPKSFQDITGMIETILLGIEERIANKVKGSQ